MNKYWFTVQPERQCQGLRMLDASKPIEDGRFLGYIEYSKTYRDFYLTVDGITYTPLSDAENVWPQEVPEDG